MGRKPQPHVHLTPRACALFERARQLRDQGAPARALRACERALDLFRRRDRRPSLDIANVLLERAGLLLELSRYGEASASIQDAVSILKGRRAGGPAGRLGHQVFIQAGHVHILRADHVHARRSFARALRLATRHGLGPIARARALNGLGLAARYTGRFDLAARFYRRARRALVRADEKTSALAATLFHNLGGLEHARGRFARAERWARRGLSLRERACGPASVETAIDVAALAAIVHARGRHDEAARLYRRALAILRRRLGPHHFEVVFNLGQLAALEQARGRFMASGRLYRRARPALERMLGRAHPVAAQVAANARALEAAVSLSAASRGRRRTGLPRAG
jgi:tetratricopeptide (TPR) repeat protein